MAYEKSREGYFGKFKIGYLQREILLHRCKVEGGVDESVHNPDIKGFAVGRLVKVTFDENEVATITGPETATDPLKDCNYIIAQSDNTMRAFPEDYIPAERYSTRYDGIVKNTEDSEERPVAVYAITNADDIELVNVEKEGE